jgi:hypothetical protein
MLVCHIEIYIDFVLQYTWVSYCDAHVCMYGFRHDLYESIHE